jgi:ABC-type branched-subunit amino acid transport system ATPase component/ABC-type branched-subunit amino acid transport system permease subunit
MRLSDLLTLGALGACAAYAFVADSYELFVLSNVCLAAMVGIGLNVLLGLAGQVSLGQVGFFAIGAYAVAILTAKAGWSFWAALPAAGALAGVTGLVLAAPALRVRGPYLAMVTIAFGFIVEHGAVEWRGMTGGANGIMGFPMPVLFGRTFGGREIAWLALALTGILFVAYLRIARGAWGQALRAARDSETAAESIGIDLVAIRVFAFVFAAVAAGLAGAVFAPLTNFVSPSAFPFLQSILFLLGVVVGGAGTATGPLVGAVVVVLLPEFLADLAEYRLLFFGILLVVVLRLAPAGIVGGLAALWSLLLPARAPPVAAASSGTGLPDEMNVAEGQGDLAVRGLSIAFGGVRAAADVTFDARAGSITSVIGPNGAGKTTVLNMLGGFYRPDQGGISLGGDGLAGMPAYRVARAGIARTYQTTQLFGSLGVGENVRIALRRGRLGGMFGAFGGHAAEADAALAHALLAFVGYRGALDRPAASLPHVDRRIVEIARALATRPRMLLLDEPAAGLGRADKDRLGELLRRIAAAGIGVVLVEHDMTLVMAVSDHVVVLDAGSPIAAGTPETVRADPAVRRAYLGDRPSRASRSTDTVEGPPLLTVEGLTIGYGAEPVIGNVALTVRNGELVAVLGANGAGKTTLMRALAGLVPAMAGRVRLGGALLSGQPADRVARQGLVLVPEGRQVFPELSVRDNLALGAFARGGADAADITALLERFPRLKERIDGRAGLLSGGEQQMLALARGLIGRPRLLMLDEPSLGLSPRLVAELFAALAALRAEGMTLLVADQMADLALSVADRAYVVTGGRVTHGGRATELAADPALERAYLGT